jgi:hypothetical protein
MNGLVEETRKIGGVSIFCSFLRYPGPQVPSIGLVAFFAMALILSSSVVISASLKKTESEQKDAQEEGTEEPQELQTTQVIIAPIVESSSSSSASSSSSSSSSSSDASTSSANRRADEAIVIHYEPPWRKIVKRLTGILLLAFSSLIFSVQTLFAKVSLLFSSLLLHSHSHSHSHSACRSFSSVGHQRTPHFSACSFPWFDSMADRRYLSPTLQDSASWPD